MKTRKIMIGLVMGFNGIAFRTAEAAATFNNALGASPVEIFRNSHPVAMMFVNVGVLVIIMGVCAVAFAVLAKGPNDL